MALAHIRTSKEFLPTVRYVSRTRPVADRKKTLPKVVFSTFPAYSPGKISECMERQAQLSSRVRKPCYHISLTLPQQDARGFEPDDWKELTQDFVERMELSDQQAVAYLHNDATYPDGEIRPHVHLVVNRVGDDGRCVSTSWDYYRAQAALREAEKDLGLTREPSSWEVGRRRDTPHQTQCCRHSSLLLHPTVRTQLQNSIDDAIDRVGSLDGVADFMQNLGVDVRISDEGWSFKHERIAISGSKLGRAYSAPAVIQRISMSQPKQPTPIGDLLRDSAENDRQDDDRRRVRNQHRISSVDGLGNQLVRENGEIDGLSLVGAGLKTTAAGLKAIDALQDAIANSRDENRAKRLEATLERMQNLGDRTERVESQLEASSRTVEHPTREERIIDIAERTERLEHADKLDRDRQHDASDRTNTTAERPIGMPEPDPVIESLLGLDDRIGSLEGNASPDRERAELLLDPQMNFEEQLGQIDALLDNLETRLDALEERVFNIGDAETQAEPHTKTEHVARSTVNNSELAGRIANYVSSRAEVYGIPVSGTIPTRSLGNIETDFNGDDATLSIRDDDYGMKFEAVRIGDRDTWEILTDELNDPERETLADLPQTADEYVERANGKTVIHSLQTLAGHEFQKPDGGNVRWQDSADGEYDFDLSPRDDGVSITGTHLNSGETVLQAEIQGGKTRVRQSDIPTQTVDRLAATATRARKRQQQRQQTRSQNRENESER
jgi:hypothetical protein